MNVQSTELVHRVRIARVARLSSQKMRLLAAERAEKLERELQAAADSGVRAEISRGLAARAQLRMANRKRAVRHAGIAALGLLLGAATSGLALVATRHADAPSTLTWLAPVPAATPGDGLKLAFSYDISPLAAR